MCDSEPFSKIQSHIVFCGYLQSSMAIQSAIPTYSSLSYLQSILPIFFYAYLVFCAYLQSVKVTQSSTYMPTYVPSCSAYLVFYSLLCLYLQSSMSTQSCIPTQLSKATSCSLQCLPQPSLPCLSILQCLPSLVCLPSLLYLYQYVTGPTKPGHTNCTCS